MLPRVLLALLSEHVTDSMPTRLAYDVLAGDEKKIESAYDDVIEHAKSVGVTFPSTLVQDSSESTHNVCGALHRYTDDAIIRILSTSPPVVSEIQTLSNERPDSFDVSSLPSIHFSPTGVMYRKK